MLLGNVHSILDYARPLGRDVDSFVLEFADDCVFATLAKLRPFPRSTAMTDANSGAVCEERREGSDGHFIDGDLSQPVAEVGGCVG